MNTEPGASNRRPPKGSSRWKRVAVIVATVVAAYLASAYLLVPRLSERYARHHSTFDDNPRITQTGDAHPGDPLSVGVIGTESEVKE